jgi:hypothetical protein
VNVFLENAKMKYKKIGVWVVVAEPEEETEEKAEAGINL